MNKFRAYRLSAVPSTPLPQLPTIRHLSLCLVSRDADFEESELTEYMLSLLATVFTNLDYLDLTFRTLSPYVGSKYSETHSVKLLSLVTQLFTGLSHCNAAYYCSVASEH